MTWRSVSPSDWRDRKSAHIMELLLKYPDPEGHTAEWLAAFKMSEGEVLYVDSVRELLTDLYWKSMVESNLGGLGSPVRWRAAPFLINPPGHTDLMISPEEIPKISAPPPSIRDVSSEELLEELRRRMDRPVSQKWKCVTMPQRTGCNHEWFLPSGDLPEECPHCGNGEFSCVPIKDD